MTKALLFALYTLCAVAVYGQPPVPDWVFKNEKDHVKVYYRKTGKVHEIKLVTSIQTGLPGIVQLFSEIDRYPVWGYKITEARLLQKVSDFELYYYSRIDFPWPLSDRDVVMHTRLVQDPKSNMLQSVSTAVTGWAPERENVVRMTDAHTTWSLHPGTNGWLYVEYEIHSDPGGLLPDWLVNMALDVGPRETIKKMRAVLAQGRYKEARVGYIRE